MSRDEENHYDPELFDGPEQHDQALSDLLVPQLFRDALEKAELTQSDLARRTGLKKDAISRYANGRTPIPDHKLIAIAQALGTQPSKIVQKRKHLDGIPPLRPDDPEFTIRPSPEPGMVRLEIAADIELETATRIVAMMTKKKPHEEED